MSTIMTFCAQTQFLHTNCSNRGKVSLSTRARLKQQEILSINGLLVNNSIHEILYQALFKIILLELLFSRIFYIFFSLNAASKSKVDILQESAYVMVLTHLQHDF